MATANIEARNKARELRAQGKSEKDIAKALGIAPASAHRYTKDIQLTEDQAYTLASRGNSKTITSVDGKRAKWCPACEKYVSEDQYKYRRNSRHFKSYCNPCNLRRKRYSRYNMQGTTVEALLASQRHRCAICNDPIGMQAHIDHCHATGLVRGLLCGGCNLALGGFRDRPEVMRKAAEYIEAAIQSQHGT